MTDTTPHDDPGFEKTTPQWETDFGPPANTRKRVLWALGCVVFVLGFLAFAIFSGGQGPKDTARLQTGIPTWILFIPFAILLVVISLTGERIALWIQRKRNWKPDID